MPCYVEEVERVDRWRGRIVTLGVPRLPPLNVRGRDQQTPFGVTGMQRRPCGASSLRGLEAFEACRDREVNASGRSALQGINGRGLGTPIGCSELNTTVNRLGVALRVFEDAGGGNKDASYAAARGFYDRQTGILSVFQWPAFGETCKNLVHESITLIKALNKSIVAAGGIPVPVPEIEISDEGGPADTLDKLRTTIVVGGAVVGLGAVVYLAGPAIREIASTIADKLKSRRQRRAR